MGKVPNNAIVKRVGNKVIVFMEAKPFLKNTNLKVLKNVKGSDVIMVILDGSVAIYTTLKGGMTYTKTSELLVNNSKVATSHLFSKATIFIAPPAGIAISIAGAIIIDYSIDKYIELNKRRYVGVEDLLWDVPDEVKNKITLLSLEDTKKETVFDFGNIDKEIILDDEADGKTILDQGNIDKETVLDY